MTDAYLHVGPLSAARGHPGARERGDLPTVVVGGMAVATVSRQTLAACMVADCLAARGSGPGHAKLVFAANGHALSRAARDPEFRRCMDAADVIHADGQPLVLASRWLSRQPIAERSATTDFVHDAARVAAQTGLRFYLLGASEDINRRCANALCEAYPGLQIAGRRNGYFGLDEEAAVCEEINAARADVVWVGMGVGLEDAFCVRNKARLNAGWLITCGGCFNFVAGDYVRAPDWMQVLGIEWLHRLLHEPRRLFRRYAVTNLHAVHLLVTRTPGPQLPRLAFAAVGTALLARYLMGFVIE